MSTRAVSIAVLVVGCSASPPESSTDEAVTCDLGAPTGLGNACDKSAAPTPINAGPIGLSGPPVFPDGSAYGVHLVKGSTNGGALNLEIGQAGTYEIYLGTPNIPFSVIGPFAEVEPTCTSSIASTECATLRKVLSYDLPRGSYEIQIGPTTAVEYVRLYIQTRIAPAQVCAAGQLSEETEACASTSNGSESIAAVPLPVFPAPTVALDTVYIVTLPSARTNSYAGAFEFTPPSDGDYEVYRGTPNIPLRVVGFDGSFAIAATACTQYIPSTECSLLRRGDRLTLHAGTTYRFELGPSTGTHYVRVTLRNSAVGSAGTVKLGAPQSYDIGGGGAIYVATADLDGDGVLDLAVSAGADPGSHYAVLRGAGDGTFALANQFPAADSPAELVIADFDHDGVPDVAGLQWDGHGPLPGQYLRGNGGFAYTQSTWASGIDYEPHLAAADFDEDGAPELLAAWNDFTTGTGGFVITKVPGFTTVQNEPAFGTSAWQAIAGDFNGDGHQDVVIASSGASEVRLYTGDGSGTVTFASDLMLPGGTITDIEAFDLDGDGRSDLVAVHADNTVTISYGLASGFAAPQILQVSGHAFYGGIAAGDFDHDGRLDLAIGGSEADFGIAIFLATDLGFVHAAALMPGGDLAVGDFNGDGFDDLAATSGGSVQIYLSTP